MLGIISWHKSLINHKETQNYISVTKQVWIFTLLSIFIAVIINKYLTLTLIHTGTQSFRLKLIVENQ